MLKVLDLFSGIGGFSLGLERTEGFETVAFCEIEPFCQQVLKKHWPDVPIYDDVRSLDYDGAVDVICGGFPCQPFSVAGKQKGERDDRHLWPAMFSLIQKHRPRWVIGENVTGIVDMALDNVLAELESEGYTCQSFIIPACAINAPHRRDRVWIVANASDKRCNNGSYNRKERHIQSKQNRNSKKNKPERNGRKLRVGENTSADANTKRSRSQGELCNDSKQAAGLFEAPPLQTSQYWRENPVPPSRVCRVDDGIPNRTHRLRSLGNAVVPQIPEIIGQVILEVELETNQEK